MEVHSKPPEKREFLLFSRLQINEIFGAMKTRKASFRRNYPTKSIFFFLFLKCFVICGIGQDLSTFSLRFDSDFLGFSTGELHREEWNHISHLRTYKEKGDIDLYDLKLLIWLKQFSPVQTPSFLTKGIAANQAFPPFQIGAESNSLMPARINPDPGYLSYLCRKELEIEEKSPIPFWFQIGENDPALVRHPRGGAVSSIKLKFKFAN